MRQLFPVFFTLLLLTGCKNGFNETYGPPEETDETDDKNEAACEQTASASNFATPDTPAIPSTQATLTLLAELGCDKIAGMLSGQNVGYGNKVDDEEDTQSSINNNFAGLISPLAELQGKDHTPAILGVDYAFDRVYSSDELLEANAILQDHWTKGGLITISWTPINPWTGANSPEPEETNSYTEDVSLEDLMDPQTEVYTRWQTELDNIAQALLNIKAFGNITVIWRPFPEMNTDKYWYGTKASKDEVKLFTDLWNQSFQKFRQLGINNLLWVYSPTFNAADKAVDWAYPDGNQVDIIGPVLRDNSLAIDSDEYQTLLDKKKVMALGEAGPAQYSANRSLAKFDEDTELFGKGNFNNRLYATILLEENKEVAYWLSWNDLSRLNSDDEEEVSRQSISNNNNADDLFDDDENILTLERVKDKELRNF